MAVTTTPTLEGVIRDTVLDELDGLHVAMPAVVLEYDSVAQKVLAQPAVQISDEEGNLSRIPPVGGVPVAFPGGGGFALTFPIQPGDAVLLVFGSHELDAWLALGGDNVEPLTARRHSLSDGVAIPELRAFTNPRVQASASDAILRDGAGHGLKITSTRVVLGTDAASAACRDDRVQSMLTQLTAWAGAVEAAINALAPGTFVPGTSSIWGTAYPGGNGSQPDTNADKVDVE